MIVALAGALLMGAGPGAFASTGGITPQRSGVPVVRSVTLVTGDVVQVATSSGGRRSVTLLPGPDGVIPQAAVNQSKDHLYVVPRSAVRLLATNKLDLRLFDVDVLLADGYGDSSRATLPVIVDFGRGAVAAARARTVTLPGATRTRTLSLLGDSAYDADKKHARQFWSAITTSKDASGTPTALAAGATRIDLDGRVHVLDVSEPLKQIHAPEAWAAGYDGAGVTVAVLDTGYDPTHPDLAGRVVGSANFTADPSVTDGHGHGTHVASTIAGSGTASGGTYKGVAPGAKLLIGKVLDTTGSGADSQVLAGMQWAVAQHADIVSMSLGGGTGDGTGPLEQAVDQLSASSPTLFVIAAGNSGPGASTVTAPGAATSALTVGAVDSTDTMASFSGRGPRLGDGGLKPDVVAPGVDIIAARAAGTSMGTPVDAYYTSASGTSMATPHVAGLAAILKQEHPQWNGATLKAAIVASAVPVTGASAYDAGTGRIDALRAVDQTVVTQPSVDLGFFAWPHSALAPKSVPLTYTNLGSTAVTLSLALASEDGTAGVPGVGLAADHLTVPAGAHASVDVTVDPTVQAAGAYSGVVTATVQGGTQTVRTAVGYVLEPERYNLTVVVKPRPGTQSASHVIGLLGFSDNSYDQRQIDSVAGAQTVTFRIAPGAYSTAVTSFGLGRDNATEGVVDVRPYVNVTQNTTLLLDEGAAKPFGYTTDRPVVNDGEVMYANWTGPHGEYTGAAIYGAFDRLYARPMVDPAGGKVDAQLNFQLSQPEAELTPVGGSTVGLRPLTATGQSVWRTPVPPVSGSYRVVDAGNAAHPRTSRVKGAVALLAVAAGTCPDLGPAAAALSKAGAVALVAYPGHGQTCAGTIVGSPLPAFQARPVAAHDLLAHPGRSARLVTHQQPGYVYDLAASWNRVPHGTIVDGRGANVAAMVEHIHSMGGTSADGLGAYDHFVGWIPGLGKAAFGLERRVPVPSTVTHYVSAVAEWERDLDIVDDTYLGSYIQFYAPPQPVKGGTTTHDTWLGGPVGDRVSGLLSRAFGPQALPYRSGDQLFALAAPLTDSSGHVGSALLGESMTARLYADGALLVDAWDPLMLEGVPVASKPTRYRLEYSLSRDSVAWQRSTTVHTVWGFTSATPKGALDVLPLMGVQFSMPLSPTNTAPASVPWTFGVTFSMPDGVVTSPVKDPIVEVSWDGGQNWRRAAVTGCGSDGTGDTGQATTCSVALQNRSSGSASLRVVAQDAAGRTVAQTILAAYAVG